jgi:hypothetical protein
MVTRSSLQAVVVVLEDTAKQSQVKIKMAPMPQSLNLAPTVNQALDNTSFPMALEVATDKEAPQAYRIAPVLEAADSSPTALHIQVVTAVAEMVQ